MVMIILLWIHYGFHNNKRAIVMQSKPHSSAWGLSKGKTAGKLSKSAVPPIYDNSHS
jgi:hypothetical protein